MYIQENPKVALKDISAPFSGVTPADRTAVTKGLRLSGHTNLRATLFRVLSSKSSNRFHDLLLKMRPVIVFLYLLTDIPHEEKS